MNKDFSKYQKIIDDFSGQVLNSDFEARFNAAGKNIPQTERFLLKMELKRLAVPCTRLIDLRGHVDGECKAFDHEGRTHYLDSVAQKVFANAYADNNGYTIAVYEATMNTENNFRVIYQKEKSKVSAKPQAEVSKVFEKSQYPAKYYRFGPYFNRREERMNFAVTIRVSLEDGSHFECTSSDLSVNGCKLRINGFKAIRVDQEITLRFTGLEDEFQFGGESDFIYQVKNLTRLDNMLLVGLERVIQEKNRPDGFKQFLLGFIQGNKRRYKINLDNTISALEARIFEQYTLPKSNELPVFIEKNNGVIKLSDCDINTPLKAEYKCEDTLGSLSYAFTNTYRNLYIIDQVLKDENEKIVLIYGKSHWYSIYPNLIKNDFKLIKGKI